MRITDPHFAAIEQAVRPLDTEHHRSIYRAGDFPRADMVKDLDKRYRWDLLHASGFRIVDLYDALDVNDTHIDSALRKIVPAL